MGPLEILLLTVASTALVLLAWTFVSLRVARQQTRVAEAARQQVLEEDLSLRTSLFTAERSLAALQVKVERIPDLEETLRCKEEELKNVERQVLSLGEDRGRLGGSIEEKTREIAERNESVRVKDGAI